MYKLAIAIFLFVTIAVQAQEVLVLADNSGIPVENVALINANGTVTVLTDFDGKADLSAFAKNDKISFRHLSYQPLTLTKTQIGKSKNKVYLELKPEELEGVVMSVSKWEQQRKDIPQKVTSIDAMAIAFSNPQTSADLLQNSGKVFLQKSQLGGGSPMIRGFATNRLLLSVDGVRMNNAIFRGGNIQNVISIDPFTIKNTEVIFGPGSVIYGSDAIGGVMNFFTKDPRFSRSEEIVISGNGNLRTNSANNEVSAHADFQLGGKKWASLSSFTYSNFDDLTMGRFGPDSYLRKQYAVRANGTDILVSNSNPRKQVPTSYDQVNVLQKLQFKPNTTWKYDFGFYYSETSDFSRYDRLIRPNSAGDGLRSAEWYYGPQKWLMAKSEITKNGKNQFYDGIKLTTAYQRFEESRNDRDFADSILNRTQEKVDAVSVNLDFENKKIGNVKLFYGAEYVFNKVHSIGSWLNIETNTVSDAPSRYPDGATWQTLAGYVNGSFKAMPNFTLLGGLRYSHVWSKARFDTTFYPFPFETSNLSTGALTGSIGVSWFPKADLQITWNTSTGFRSPNIDDKGKIFDSEPGSVIVPNDDLESEYAYNMEFGVRKNFNNLFVVKAAGYYTYLVDALVRRDFSFNGEREIEYNGELSNVQAIQNAASAYVYGLELGVDVFLNEQLSFTSNLTLTEGMEEDDDGSESPSRHVAPTFADAHLVWQNQRVKADLFVNYNGKLANSDLALSEQSKAYLYATDTNGNPYSPAWHTLNLRTQYKISNAITLGGSIENITDQRYRSYSSGIAASGINFIGSLGYRF